MKTITEYTNNEILELADDDVSKIIDFQCALAGIPLLPDEPKKPIKPEHELDSEIYRVGDFAFRDQESAELVMGLINKQQMVKVDYDYQIGYDYKYVTVADSGASITVEKYLSLNAYDSAKSEIAKSKSEFDVYNTLNDIYLSVFDQRAEVSSDVWRTISEARAERDSKLDALSRFEKYLAMAEGNKTLAYKFFCDAYPADSSLIEFENEEEAA